MFPHIANYHHIFHSSLIPSIYRSSSDTTELLIFKHFFKAEFGLGITIARSCLEFGSSKQLCQNKLMQPYQNIRSITVPHPKTFFIHDGAINNYYQVSSVPSGRFRKNV